MLQKTCASRKVSKLRAGLKGRREIDGSYKRKRNTGDHEADIPHDLGSDSVQGHAKPMSETQSVFKKPRRGEKGLNLLSIKKPNKRASRAEKLETLLKSSTAIDLVHGSTSSEYNSAKSGISGGEEPIRRKRQRKHKPRGDSESAFKVVEVSGGY